MKYVTVEDLSLQYDSRPVLEGINYRLDSGELVTLTGENGAAKSTLARMTLDILTLRSGQVTISETNREGKELRVAYLPQQVASFNVGFPSTIYEFVRPGCRPRNDRFRRLTKYDDEHIKTNLKSIGMWENRHKRIGSLSGGQKQHVVIIRIFASDPDIFILDEPTTGIDAGATETFYELMHHSAHKHGKSILMITHDPDEMKYYAGRNIHLIRNRKALWRCFNIYDTDIKGAVDVD